MIISRHEYESMKNDLHLAKLVIKLKNEKIAFQQEVIRQLTEVNDALRCTAVKIDFPNSKTSCEDKII